MQNLIQLQEEAYHNDREIRFAICKHSKAKEVSIHRAKASVLINLLITPTKKILESQKIDQPLFYDAVNVNASGDVTTVRAAGNGFSASGADLLKLDLDAYGGKIDDFNDMSNSEWDGKFYGVHGSCTAFKKENIGTDKHLKFHAFLLLSRTVNPYEYKIISTNYKKYLESKYSLQIKDGYIDNCSTQVSRGFYYGGFCGDGVYYRCNFGETVDVDAWLYEDKKEDNKTIGKNEKLFVAKLHDVYKPKQNKNLDIDELHTRLKNVDSLLKMISSYEYETYLIVVLGVSDYLKRDPEGIVVLREWLKDDPRMGVEIEEEESYEDLERLYYTADADRKPKAKITSVERIIYSSLKQNEKLLLTGQGYKIISTTPNIDDVNLLSSYEEEIDKARIKFSKNNKGDITNIAYLERHNLNVLIRSYGIDIWWDDIKKRIKFNLSLPLDNRYSHNVFSDDANMDDLLDFIGELVEVNKLTIKNSKTDKLLSSIRSYALTNRKNPLKELINSKQWDGKSRINDLLDLIKLQAGLSSEQRAFLSQLIIKSFVGFVGMQYDNCGCGGILILQGKQGIGKTRFIRKLLPKEFSSYISTGQNLDITTRDGVQTIGQFLIVEQGEIEDIIQSRAEGKLKNFFTAITDVYRKAYEADAREYARRTLIIGTTNESTFLKDVTGNRRYWVIPCEKIDYKAMDIIDLQQLYAELHHMWSTGQENAFLNDTMIELLEEHNNSFMQESTFMDAFNSVAIVSSDCDAEYLTIAEILSRMGWDSQRVPPQTIKTYKAYLIKEGARKKGHNTFGVKFHKESETYQKLRKEEWSRFANRK